jgi:hypothetical protein
MTAGEPRRGLAFMKPAQAYAIVFALETGMLRASWRVLGGSGRLQS